MLDSEMIFSVPDNRAYKVDMIVSKEPYCGIFYFWTKIGCCLHLIGNSDELGKEIFWFDEYKKQRGNKNDKRRNS